MVIKRFEDIQAWQEAWKLVKMIFLLTDEGKFAKDFGLRDQIRRASVSIMANIAEEFDCDSQVAFARFLGIARRSAVEVQSLFYAALDVEYIAKEDFKTYYVQTDKAKALTGAFRHALLRKKATKP